MAATYWALLVKALPTTDEIRPIAVDVGVGAGDVFWNRAGKDVWRDVLEVVCRASLLPKLHDAVCAAVPGSHRALLDAARPTACGRPHASVVATGVWYQAPTAFDSRFVGPAAQLPMIDRTSLRAGLDQMMTQGWPVLLVFGDPGTGRSYSWYLVQHVAQSVPRFRTHLIDIERHWGLADFAPGDLIASIGNVLGLKAAFSGDGTTDTVPRLFGSWLDGQLADRKGHDCLVIDGVDRPNVLPATRALVRDLISRVARLELPGLRLIVTGRRDSADVWDPTVGSSIVYEDIAAIDAGEVRKFFAATAEHLGRPLDDAGVAAMLAKVDAHLLANGPIERLGPKVGELARVLGAP